MAKKYATLNFIANLYILGGYLLFIASFIIPLILTYQVVASPYGRGGNSGAAMVTLLSLIPIILGSILGSLSLFGVGQAIKLFIDMELNSRISAQAAIDTAKSIDELNSLMRKLVQRRSASSTERE